MEKAFFFQIGSVMVDIIIKAAPSITTIFPFNYKFI